MNPSRFSDLLAGREGNYLFPFLWLRKGSRDKIPAMIERIRRDGCRAFCVESRPHPDFCGDSWWEDMDIVLAEAKARDMKVWLLDDRTFPTGKCNRAIETKRPDLRQWELTEFHTDVCGPLADAAFLVAEDTEESVFLSAVAYPRGDSPEELLRPEPVVLTDRVRDGVLSWDVPAGVWRIFFFFQSRKGIRPGFMDMLNPASVDLLIEEVYEPHYAHYAAEFGKTFAGFFSDEPGFGNSYYGQAPFRKNSNEQTVGCPGLALPWSRSVREKLTDRLGFDPLRDGGFLWYDEDGDGGTRAKIRAAYMDVITEEYRDNFPMRVGGWCRAHGVEYIGHIIEDNGAHARLFFGPGHYFRAMTGQDMAGMDIVLHQVRPGFSGHKHSALVSCSFANGEFYHYLLAKLPSSLAHIEPKMRGRALCEVFGAYGWAEDLPLMKFLIDFLFVRGINHFVPHAFSPDFPDDDCPPHFGAMGHDPSEDGFRALMRYANRGAHLLQNVTHVANVALLYHAEGEWASRTGTAMPDEVPAHRLMDAQIDFDILPEDYLGRVTVDSGKLRLNGLSFDCLVVPSADHLPDALLTSLSDLAGKGATILFLTPTPAETPAGVTPLPVQDLVPFLRARGMTDLSLSAPHEKLRALHVREENGKDLFLFVNEDPTASAETTVHLPVTGDFLRADLLNDAFFSDTTITGDVPLSLLPGESVWLLFGEDYRTKPMPHLFPLAEFSPHFSLELADADEPWVFRPAGESDSFFNVTAADRYPRFSGKMRYTFSLPVAKKPRGTLALDLGRVGQIAELSVNGTPLGIRVTPPYRFDVTDVLREGDNQVTVTVSGTLAPKVRDRFSFWLPLSPSGLLGGLRLLGEKDAE